MRRCRPSFPLRDRKQRHNAGNLAFDAVVAYPFHPLVGQTVLVVGEQEHNGVRHFLIRQPHDGTLHVPDWMVTPQAGSHAIVATPRIPLNALLELRAILDHLVVSSEAVITPTVGQPVSRRCAVSKISAEHLCRDAIVYIRQSTSYQVANNLESQRRQYALADRARQLGWSDVQIVDDDLGRSGAGTARPGFEKLLAAICEGRVGAVVSLEASRLARNGRDWHTLLEFCGLVGTLIVDEDGIYDPRSINDRLLLGMKGTMSEMELSIFRQRSLEALKQKARRGELLLMVAVGYVKAEDGRIEKDPDRRVQDSIALVFRKFAELQSIRQVLLWFREEQVVVPAVVQGHGKQTTEWKAPVYYTLHHVLTNPVYAGAYVFGRRGTRVVIEGGRKRIVRDSIRRNWKDWEVLIRDHHEAYISWDEFERNQRLIADNANGKSYLGRGAIRRGEALLPGLFR